MLCGFFPYVFSVYKGLCMVENGYDINKIFIRKLRPCQQEIVSGIAG